MKRLLTLTAPLLLLSQTACSHGTCAALGAIFNCNCTSKPELPYQQDMSIEVPSFNSSEPMDAVVDGYVLRAIRVAADQYLGPERPDQPCQSKQASHEYRAIRRGDIIFVRIDYKPESCGEKLHPLDAGATYAIDIYGRILRFGL